jgi:putative transposase
VERKQGNKYRLKLNKKQAKFFDKMIGCSRFVYNFFLDAQNNLFSEDGTHLNHEDMCLLLTDLKNNTYDWLNEPPISVLQNSLKDLFTARKNFFSGQCDYPNFKNKYSHQSARINNILSNPKSKNPQYTIQLDQNKHKILIPKLGWVNYYRSHRLYGKITSATISKDPDGYYYISLQTENDYEVKQTTTIKEIGVDLGLKSFIVTSDGDKIDAPKFFKKSKQKLAREQKKFNRKNFKPVEAQDGAFDRVSSNRRNKQRLVVAKIHKKISNQRSNFSHNLSSKLINENQVISLETLSVKNMIKNRKLSAAIADASWGEFTRQLEYKAKWNNKTILRIGRFEPSTKTCHKCGNVKEDLTLKDRSWNCENCKTLHDRDLNAAINILCIGKCPDIDKEINNPCKSGAGAWGAEAGVEPDVSSAVKCLITNMSQD